MLKNNTLNLLIGLSLLLILGFASFLGYQLLRLNKRQATPAVQNQSTVPTDKVSLFFATVDSFEDSQVHLTLINPPVKKEPQTILTKTKITNPVVYFGAINDISIPYPHFQTKPSLSDTVAVYGEPSHEGQAFTITQINLIK